jgi:hypothetical protein
VPNVPNAFDTLLNDLNERLSKGKGVAVHCRAGIGRSAIIAASLLTRNGCSAEAAFSAIQKARGIPVPDTPDQRRWVEQYSLGGPQQCPITRLAQLLAIDCSFLFDRLNSPIANNRNENHQRK